MAKTIEKSLLEREKAREGSLEFGNERSLGIWRRHLREGERVGAGSERWESFPSAASLNSRGAKMYFMALFACKGQTDLCFASEPSSLIKNMKTQHFLPKEKK